MDELTLNKVVVIGEILVEIMADQTGPGFLEPISLTGPYPSGAPAIFIDEVARLGQPCAIVSAVGDDDFGRINLNRLVAHGVDTNAVFVDPDRPTGTAFVRYRDDGTRDFIYNIRHSACGRLPQNEQTSRVLAEAGHLHVMGSSLSSGEFAKANLKAAASVRARGGTVSFDPNMRKEMLEASGLRDAMQQMLPLTDVFMPSGSELTLLTSAQSDEGAVRELLGHGIGCIVHKLGNTGVRFHDGGEARLLPAFSVSEVDPTGAGDTFGGAFIAFWLQKRPIGEVLTLAAAAGAIAVQHKGPMEGTSTLDEIQAFMAQQAS